MLTQFTGFLLSETLFNLWDMLENFHLSWVVYEIDIQVNRENLHTITNYNEYF